MFPLPTNALPKSVLQLSPALSRSSWSKALYTKEPSEVNWRTQACIPHLDYTKLYIISVQLIRDRIAVAVLNLKGDLLLKRDISPVSFTQKNSCQKCIRKWKTSCPLCY